MKLSNKFFFRLWKAKRWVVKKTIRPFCLYMDISGCNLRCVMCPRGGVSGLKNESRRLMDLELFKRVAGKFVDEKVKIGHMEFGVWGEPLLNPDLSKMVRHARSKSGLMTGGGEVIINTNLSHLPDPAELVESGVDRLRISVSGMTQETYSKNHKGGDIDRVLKNILELADIKRKKRSEKPKLHMIYQELNYNKGETDLAKRFCGEHGLTFVSRRMRITSVDENIRFKQDRERLTRLYSEFIDLEKEASKMRTMDLRKIKDCGLRKDRVTIDPEGRLYACCCVFDQRHFLGSFFDFKVRDIPDINSAICKECARTPISWRR